MCGDHELQYWILDEFSRHGRDGDGSFIGIWAFKLELVRIGRSGTSAQKIREVVDSMARDEIIPSTSWRDSLAKLVYNQSLVHAFNTNGNMLRRKVIAQQLCDLAPASLHTEIVVALAGIDTAALNKHFNEIRKAARVSSPPPVSSASYCSASEASPASHQTILEARASPSSSPIVDPQSTAKSSVMSSSELEDFVCQQIPIIGFDSRGQWIGFEHVKRLLYEQKPGYESKIESLVERIKYVFENAEAQRSEMAESERRNASARDDHTEKTVAASSATAPSSSINEPSKTTSARSDSFSGILDESVEAWVERQFYLGGLDENGAFIGLPRFETFLGNKLQGKQNKSRRARVFKLVREMYSNRSFPLASWNNSATQSVIDDDVGSILQADPAEMRGVALEADFEPTGRTADSLVSDSATSSQSQSISMPGDSPITCQSEYTPDRSLPATPQSVKILPIVSPSTPSPASFPQSRIRNLETKTSISVGISDELLPGFGGPEATPDELDACPSMMDVESGVGALDDVTDSQSQHLPRTSGNARYMGYEKGEEALLKELPARIDQSQLLDFRGQRSEETDVERAVLFSARLFDLNDRAVQHIPQYGLLGNGYPLTSGPGDDSLDQENLDRRIFLNTNHPASFFICGLQGSGKSHTTSCLLENFLLHSQILGSLEHQCSAMVFHYAQFVSRETFMPCEAAFLAQRGQQFPDQPAVDKVNVLVSPSNFHVLRRAYSGIPGVNVRKLKLKQKDLTISSLLTLMSFDPKQQPLYMGEVTRILRKMAEETDGPFDYHVFRKRLAMARLMPDQRRPLDQRLDLLESFLDIDDQEDSFDFGPGTLTIVDLSCPFLDESNACMLFNICIGMYLEDKSSSRGKIIAVDEAHKYMTDTPASKALTEQLLSVIRQQRHYGTRVIISTQEPTISPRLMDLSSATIIHRFSSPEWFNILKHHVSVVHEADKNGNSHLFDSIIDLAVGEALVFAPSAMISHEAMDMPRKLGSKVMRLAVRKRLTWDGGRSVTCI